MSERLSTPRLTEKPEWSELLKAALEMPGSLGSTYSRFYNYSFGNQILLFMQGVDEPVNTYKRWAAMDRQVKKGSRAKAILAPMIGKGFDKDGLEERQVKGFKLLNCLFTLSETEGDELPPFEPAAWSKARALGALAITEIPFGGFNPNAQGYSVGREFAINPIAAYPFKTTIHELGHIVLGHTTPDQLEEYRSHRGIREFEAESTAYLAMNELDALDQFDAAESRSYIQTWLGGERPDDASIKRVLNTTDKILKAGREVPNE